MELFWCNSWPCEYIRCLESFATSLCALLFLGEHLGALGPDAPTCLKEIGKLEEEPPLCNLE